MVIPTYNWATVLPYSIASALGQTFGDFELLVIGDGCTDESEDVVRGIGDERVQWINPHTWIWIDVKKPDGTSEEWGIEAGTPNTLFRLGLTREALPVGTHLITDGRTSRIVQAR